MGAGSWEGRHAFLRTSPSDTTGDTKCFKRPVTGITKIKISGSEINHIRKTTLLYKFSEWLMEEIWLRWRRFRQLAKSLSQLWASRDVHIVQSINYTISNINVYLTCSIPQSDILVSQIAGWSRCWIGLLRGS